MEGIRASSLEFSDPKLKGVELDADYFELRVKIAEDEYRLAARLYKIKNSQIEQDFVIKRICKEQSLFDRACQELTYYLCELPAERMNSSAEITWEYQQYHTSTAANVYSQVHWRYISAPSERVKNFDNDNKANKVRQANIVTSASKASKWVLLYRFRRELTIAVILLMVITLHNSHWSVNFLLILLSMWGTRLSFLLAVEKSRRQEKFYKRAFWYVMSYFMGFNSLVIAITIFFN